MNWLRNLFQRRRMTDDLSEEMRQHLEEKIEAPGAPHLDFEMWDGIKTARSES